MNIFSFVYLAVFLLAGFCIARRALPQAGLSVSIPLGCGFGVSLLAFVPACFAVVLGFRLPALLLAAAVVAALAVWLARHGTPFTRVPDPDAAALWACVLPLAVVTLYLLHTHVLHLVDGSYHTGQSCYGDMAMHLGFIKNIAVTGKLPPVYPLLGGEHRFGYPFLCETVSSVFLVLGADARTAYLLHIGNLVIICSAGMPAFSFISSRMSAAVSKSTPWFSIISRMQTIPMLFSLANARLL